MSKAIDQLREIFTDHPAGRAATRPLRSGVRVGLRIHGEPGDFTFERTKDGAEIVEGKLDGTDFDLTLGAEAVRHICATEGTSVGDFGVSFLQTLLRDDEASRVEVKLHAGLMGLTRNGYLSVMALGGPKVLGFLTKEGYIGPRGIAKAIRRLRQN